MLFAIGIIGTEITRQRAHDGQKGKDHWNLERLGSCVDILANDRRKFRHSFEKCLGLSIGVFYLFDLYLFSILRFIEPVVFQEEIELFRMACLGVAAADRTALAPCLLG